MSPTIFWPGFSAVKSRLTRSGIGGAAPSCSVSEWRVRPGLAGFRAELAHEPADELVAALFPAADQDLVHAPVAVFLVIRLQQGFYLDLQEFPSLRGG
jgi:hypothetical protein